MKMLIQICWWLMGLIFLITISYGFYFLIDSGSSIWLGILISIYIIQFIFTLSLFSQRRHPSAKLSWLVLMILLPFFAHIIFFVFGQRYKLRKDQKEYLQKENFKYEKIENSNFKIIKNNDIRDIFKKQVTISKRGVYSANYKLYRNGIEAYKGLFNDMRKAKLFLHIEFYIIHKGEIYDEFKSILIKKAKEGVEVRFIVDDFGRWAMPWYEIKILKNHGIKVEIFGKVFFPFIGSNNGYRCHRKLVIIDGDILHTGGMNIGDEYASLDKRYGTWIDFQTRVTGEIVRSTSLMFLQDWIDLSDENIDFKKYLLETKIGKSVSILIEGSPEVKEPILQDSLINWIINAKKTIDISTPYFIPTSAIFAAFRIAAKSGVKIRIFIPGKADKKIVLIATKYWARELIKYGVDFFEIKDILIHSKIGIFDGKFGYFGTMNVDMRSMFSQLEFIQLVSGPVINDLQKLIESYSIISNKLFIEKIYRFKVIDKLIGIYVRLSSPIM